VDTKKIQGSVVKAEVLPNENGIMLRILLDNNKYVVVTSTTEDPWLRIPEGKDAKKELQEVCDLFNGYKIVNGEKEIKLMVTFDPASIPDLASIQNMQILNMAKQPVFLKDVAKIELKPAVDVILDETGLVERVGVDGDLNVEFVCDAEAGVDRRGRRAPVLVQFQTDGSGEDLFAQRLGRRAVALAEEAEIDRVGLGGLQHAMEVPCARRAGCRQRAVSRPGASAEHGGDAGADRLVDLLRADEVNV